MTRVLRVQYVFMDNTSYEETRLKKDESWSRYLKEGTEVALLFWNGKVISVDPPVTVDLEVTDTDPGLKGNTAQGRSPRSKIVHSGIFAGSHHKARAQGRDRGGLCFAFPGKYSSAALLPWLHA